MATPTMNWANDEDTGLLGLFEREHLVLPVAVFAFAFLSNAWIVDDAYITFRTIYNWYEGYGLRWNTFERVQSFTHPLWMLSVSLAYGVTQEFFFTTLALSGAMCAATLWLTMRRLSRRAPWQAALFVLLLLSSKAFIDYSSSGLENPLSYLLVAYFYSRFLFDAKDSLRDAGVYVLVASLAFVNRMDTVLLFVPVLAYLSWSAMRAKDLRVWGSMLLAGLPALLWLSFAWFYYGFPFPNTYYAKAGSTGIESSAFLQQGFAYFLNSLMWDPPTLILMGVVTYCAARYGSTRVRLSAAGVLLYLVYVLKVGASGTHMTGRFFAVPYLLAVIVLFALPLRANSGKLGLALATMALIVCPMSPLKANTAYYQSGRDGSGEGRNGIIDTRYLVQTFDGSSLFNFERRKAMPNMVWFEEGKRFRGEPERVRVGGHGPAVGFFGFAAGPHKVIIDAFGLTDALLARLPAPSPDWYGGHFARALPAGYEESVRRNVNVIVDPALHAYYDKLILVTRGGLFSVARLRAIWDLNFGSGKALLLEYDAKSRSGALG